MERERSRFERVSASLPRKWIGEALEACGVATVRRRRLPADMVVWLVLGMALLRNRAIDEVARSLELALPGSDGKPVSHSALIQARDRLGEEPLRWLFRRSGHEWAFKSAKRHAWRGLSIFGVDGSTFRLPDSEENTAHFGKHSNQKGESGYPIARAVTLMALRSHLLADMRVGPHTESEQSLAADLWAELPDDSLTLVDRYFNSVAVLVSLERGGRNRHWLRRAKKGQVWRNVETFGANDHLVEVDVDSHSRRGDASLPKVWRFRAIRYQRRGFPPSFLLTSLLDPMTHPPHDLVALYHERWEIELGYGEVKRVMLEREEALRSRHPRTVYQELWGLAIMYNLLRLEMERCADELGVAPTRLSFKAAFVLIRDWFLSAEFISPGAIPKRLRALRDDISHFVLPPRRSRRSYPRAVKVALSPYPSLTQARKVARRTTRGK